MTTARRWFAGIGFAPVMLVAMVLALWTSSGARLSAQPFCQGAGCDPKVPNDCGSKCVCNSVEKVCLDNTDPPEG